jgi:hypothetical protein
MIVVFRLRRIGACHDAMYKIYALQCTVLFGLRRCPSWLVPLVLLVLLVVVLWLMFEVPEAKKQMC